MTKAKKLRPKALALLTPAILAPIVIPCAHAFQVCPVRPCRILDTRIGTMGTDVTPGCCDTTPNYAGPLAPNQELNIDVTQGVVHVVTPGGGVYDETVDFTAGQGGSYDVSGGEVHCGIPYVAAKGIFANVVAVQPTGAMNNHLKVYPYGSPEPDAATLSYEPGTFALANGVFVKLCSDCPDDLTIKNGSSASTQVVIDVTAYVATSCQ